MHQDPATLSCKHTHTHDHAHAPADPCTRRCTQIHAHDAAHTDKCTRHCTHRYMHMLLPTLHTPMHGHAAVNPHPILHTLSTHTLLWPSPHAHDPAHADADPPHTHARPLVDLLHLCARLWFLFSAACAPEKSSRCSHLPMWSVSAGQITVQDCRVRRSQRESDRSVAVRESDRSTFHTQSITFHHQSTGRSASRFVIR